MKICDFAFKRLRQKKSFIFNVFRCTYLKPFCLQLTEICTSRLLIISVCAEYRTAIKPVRA